MSHTLFLTIIAKIIQVGESNLVSRMGLDDLKVYGIMSRIGLNFNLSSVGFVSSFRSIPSIQF
jgi:hypothetical protein